MRTISFAIAVITLLSACDNIKVKVNTGEKKEISGHSIPLNLDSIMTDKKLVGAMFIYEPASQDSFVYNPADFNTQRTPASTFKIMNSLIGLETGVIKDENFTIMWDKVKRSRENWNADHDLKTAYKNSTLWYYQELARRVGGKDMKFWLDKVEYGNADTSGGIDQFWLNGSLRISIAQQIDFLKKLQENKLPFSQRSMDIVKKIMIAEETPNYTLRAKTGWGVDKDTDIGWYVGYVTTPTKIYYFANCVQNNEKADTSFFQNRILIAREGLTQAGAIK